MFETRTQIRREATLKALAEREERGIRIGEERGERRSADRIRAELIENGVELSPEIEKRIFGSNGHKS